jgi:osmotically-inducible protein OsmY
MLAAPQPGAQEVILKSDCRLQQDVRAELDLELRLQTTRIRVQVMDGAVTLAGEVANHAEKCIAERAVRRVAGVRRLATELRIEPAPTTRKTDADIASSIEAVLQCLSFVPRHCITVAVENGRVTLGGAVDWQYQKQAVVSAVRRIPGACRFADEIALKPDVSDLAVKGRIESGLRRRTAADVNNIVVDVHGSEVTLSGTIQSWLEHDVATCSAWEAPGVSKVIDRLTFAY